MPLAAKKIPQYSQDQEGKSIQTRHTFQATSVIPTLSCNVTNLAALSYQSHTDQSKIQ